MPDDAPPPEQPAEPPRRKRGRPPKNPATAKIITPPRLDIEAPDDPDGPIKKSGLPRTGNYPVRAPRAAKPQRTHRWAASDRWMPIFVKALARYGNVQQACDVACVNRMTVLRRRKENAEFDQECKDADECFTDRLEGRLFQLAMDGQPTYMQDRKTGDFVQLPPRADPLLMMFALKRRRPEYRDSYKPEEKKTATEELVSHIKTFLTAFDPNSDDQSLKPSLADMAGQKAIEVEARSLTIEEERDRLLERLAELDAREMAAKQKTMAAEGGGEAGG